MTCPVCGAVNPAGQKFCGECGGRLAIICARCGSAVAAGQKFCGECGAPIASAAVPASAAGGVDPAAERLASAPASAAPVAERRLVSVLFADLVGFTPFAEDRDAELVRDTLSRYFALASDVVARYGGTIEKFIGDAVMAVWGAPTAHEDDGERAVRAALELVDQVPSLGNGIQARAGVMTGEAAVTVGAVNQGLVAGDLVNTASRLQAAAPAGCVLVDERTRGTAARVVAFEPAGEQVLKGKSLPVAAWRAARVIGDRASGGRGDQLEAPFVGRAEELRMLKEQFHATGRERRARLASVIGQAGIGKTRLAWELEKYLDGVVEVVRWHRGRSPAYGEGVTFWALGEMIRRRAGLAEGDDEATTRRAIAAMLAEHVPDAVERRWIEPRLLALLAIQDAPTGDREELFAAWRTFFERLALSGTVALVFEDIQWADDGLLDFIEHLLDWSRNQPIFVLTLGRPEVLERRPGWGTDRRGGVALRLDPLPSSAMRELLAGLAPGLPEQTVARILGRADGIPLYAVETIRMLVADGSLVAAQDGTYSPVGDLGNLDVPATLHALVAARLDALPAAERSIMQVAAVLGQSFTEAALGAVAEEDPASLAPLLASLRRRELLAIENDPRAPTRGQHAFVQALVREVAYATLSRKERRARHVAAARYFESLADEELAGALATHHLAAWRAAPEGPEGEAAAAQARVTLRAAADRAEALGARGQAADWLGAALEVTTDPSERAALLSRRGRTAGLAARPEGLELLAEAVEAWRAIGDPVQTVKAIAGLALFQLGRGEIVQAQTTLASGRAIADALEGNEAAAPILAEYWETSARHAFRAASSEDAIAWADRALAIAEALRLDEVIDMALVTKASALVNLGRYREGIALLTGAYQDAGAHGQTIPQLRAGVNLAAMTSDIDPGASLARTREGMATARRLGLATFAPYHGSNLSSALRLGEWQWMDEAAAELLEQVTDTSIRRWIASTRAWLASWRGEAITELPESFIQTAVEDGDPQALANALTWEMERKLVAGDIEGAMVPARRLLTAGDFVSPGSQATVGRIALHAGDLELAGQVITILTPPYGGATDADLEMLQAGLAARRGEADQAVALYRRALAAYRDLGLVHDVAMTALDMLAFLGPGDASAQAVVPEARATFARVGARTLLERLDRLAGEPPAASARPRPSERPVEGPSRNDAPTPAAG